MILTNSPDDTLPDGSDSIHTSRRIRLTEEVAGALLRRDTGKGVRTNPAAAPLVPSSRGVYFRETMATLPAEDERLLAGVSSPRPPCAAKPSLPTSRRAAPLLWAVVAFVTLAVGWFLISGHSGAWLGRLNVRHGGVSGARPRELLSARSSPAAAPATPLPSSAVTESPGVEISTLPRAGDKYGVLHVGREHEGHRVFVDGVVVGGGNGDYEVQCGRRVVKVGSRQTPRVIAIPCGGTTNAW